MFGPSDIYGDMSLEDTDEFEGLQPNNKSEIDPMGLFEHAEVRSFDRDFDEELGYEDNENDHEEIYDEEESYLDSEEYYDNDDYDGSYDEEDDLYEED